MLKWRWRNNTMSLPSYPPALPNQSQTLLAYDRGSQAYFFKNAVSTSGALPAVSSTYGNSLGAPTGSVIYGIPNAVAVENAMQDIMIQVDCYGSTATAGPGATVALYGSLDAVQFYALTTVAVTTIGALVSLAKLITPGIKPKYITAGVTAYTGVGGTTDSVTCSMFA